MTQIKQTDLRQGWRNPIDTVINTDDWDQEKYADVLKWVKGDYSISITLEAGGTGKILIQGNENLQSKVMNLFVHPVSGKVLVQ